MSKRVIEPELLDHASDADVQANLADLRRINRWFGGESALRYALKGYERASILDVGAASGEVARLLPNALVVSLDWQIRNLREAPKPVVVANAFQLPFAGGTFDVAACALFLHHFENPQIVELLREFARVAPRIAVVDLERHVLAERFLPLTRPLFGWKNVTLHDGPVSVRAAFKPAELAELATQAGLANVVVRRHIPWFRISLVATRKKG